VDPLVTNISPVENALMRRNNQPKLKRTLSLSITNPDDGAKRDTASAATGRQRSGHGRFAHRLEMRNRNFNGSTQVPLTVN